ncbi:hypothetical protein HA402_011574 [Bradysia odoriphaga]|nr:hypothetical protein HA402_011574 [Bradysia odoriphaga]
MDTSSVFPPAKSKIKIPDVLDFSKYLLKEKNIYHQRLSAYANIVRSPELIYINVALTKRQNHIIRDSPVKFLNGSKIEASILCSKYAQNFGIMGDVTIFPSRTKGIEHNLQLEMSTTGPLVRYTLMMAKNLKNDLVQNVSAQLIASGSCGLMPSTTVNQPFAIGAHLWAPFPFVESFRSHVFVGFGASPNQPSYIAGIGFSTQFAERGRIDIGYCLKTGVRFGIGFDYDERIAKKKSPIRRHQELFKSRYLKRDDVAKNGVRYNRRFDLLMKFREAEMK